mmetsp:Transcript_38882/g.57143  ORF Transcript_38882/g.57143 Transcript_38882/m.57143 type:complete len:98 (-) Transcript_38882:48-341(-)
MREGWKFPDFHGGHGGGGGGGGGGMDNSVGDRNNNCHATAVVSVAGAVNVASAAAKAGHVASKTQRSTLQHTATRWDTRQSAWQDAAEQTVAQVTKV